jgi:trehalose-phosphatase
MLFDCWAGIAGRLRAYDHVLLLSDFDGTLTPIVDRPEQAILDQATGSLLAGLAQSARYTVGVVSGRALADLQSRVGIPGLQYAGNHGLEMAGPGTDFTHRKAIAQIADLQAVHLALREKLAAFPEILIENKGLTLSVHYRLAADEQVEAAREAFDAVLRAPCLLGRLTVTTGKKVWEVRPVVAWDKGAAVAMLLKRARRRRPGASIGVIYLGDDRTDEAAFRTVDEAGGIAIYVGPPPPETVARYRLPDSRAVQEFLGRLAALEAGDVEPALSLPAT